MLSAPAKLSMLWFGDNERAIATTFGSMAVPLGCLLAFVLPNWFVNDHHDKYPETDDKWDLED